MEDFQCVETSLRTSFRVVAAHRPAGELREMDGVAIASAGVTFQMFNAPFLSAPVSSEGQMDRRVAQAAVHFAARGQRWAYWICEGWLEGRPRRRLKHLLGKHNLYQAVELPGMIAERVLSPKRQLPLVEVRRGARRAAEEGVCASCAK